MMNNLANVPFQMPDFASSKDISYILSEDRNNPPKFTTKEIMNVGNVFAKQYRKARIITFTENFEDGGESVIKHHGGIAGKPILDLPFEICLFNALPGIIPIERKGCDPRLLLALLVTEHEPGIYEYFSMEAPVQMGLTNKQIISLHRPVVFHIPANSNEDVIFDYHFITKKMVDRLKSSDHAIGTINPRQNVRVGQGKDRTLHKIREVVFVIPKKNQSKARDIVGVEVDWSHRWEVRGHWRKISRIGKNRAGQYGIQGLTWVVPHVKGPEDKPVVKKQRVVLNAQK